MITSITLTGNTAERIGKSPITYKFEPGVNLLLGPNGCGKSTIVSALRAASGVRHVKVNANTVEVKTSGAVRLRSFDFEKENIRTQNQLKDDATQLLFQVNSFFMSHGETVRPILEAPFCDQEEPTVLVLDEPDQALDLDGILWFKKILRKAHSGKIKNVVQVVLACHNPALILDNPFNRVEMVNGWHDHVLETMNKIIREENNGK